MVKPNPLRDASTEIFTQRGFTVTNNYVKTGGSRYINLEFTLPERNVQSWKTQQIQTLRSLGLHIYEDDRGFMLKGKWNVSGILPASLVPGYIDPTNTTAASTLHETLPQDVKHYITHVLGQSLDLVVAHRIVNGDEPLYAVLMGREGSYWVVAFTGTYEARRPLGDYEEATTGNARRVGWNCLYDAEEWDFSVARFRNAGANMF